MPTRFRVAATMIALILLVVLATDVQARRRGGRRGPSSPAINNFTPSFSSGAIPTPAKAPSVAQPVIENTNAPRASVLRSRISAPAADKYQNRVLRSVIKSPRTPQPPGPPEPKPEPEFEAPTYHRPFSQSWFQAHPKAFTRYQSYQHNRTSAWASATFGSIAAYLGISSQPLMHEGRVYVGRSVRDLAARGKQLERGAVMDLGVFDLLSPGSGEAMHLVQLSINREGLLVGSYYDVLSDASQPLTGSLDRRTQRVAWTLGGNESVVFETNLQHLAQDESTVLVHLADGRTQNWTMVRNSK